MTIRFLAVVAVFCALCFGVRFGEMLTGIKSAGSISAYAANGADTAAAKAAPPPESALEESSEKPSLPEPPRSDAPVENVTPQKAAPKTAAPMSADKKTDETAKAKDKNWKASDDLDDDYADVKMELFEDLSRRRKDLDAKEKELAMREALIKAAQAELEQKTKELTGIKTDIEALLKQQTEQEDKRIASLVKIYEGMKAKDAARIFDTLDQDVLIQVVTKMSERKTAPILAAMDADKARNLTIMLAEQSKLPSMPALTTQ